MNFSYSSYYNDINKKSNVPIQSSDNLKHDDSVDISFFKTFKSIHDYVSENGKLLLFMGEGQHKIKRKAEQIACNEAIKFIPENNSEE